MADELKQELDALVTRIEAHQKSLKLSDSRFVARYQRYLGSSKSWRDRLCGRAWADLGGRLEKWRARLRSFVDEIDGATDITEFFDQLPIARYGQAVFDQLQGQRSDRRLAWLIGPTGVGKTWIMRRLCTENPRQAVYLHVHRGAKDSLMVIAKMLALAVGATVECSAAATFVNVVEALKGNPLTLCLDDLHEGGTLLLKLLKHVLDESRTKLIVATYPTGWSSMVNGSTDAYSEAQQLIGRSLKPVDRRWIKGATVEDVTAYLKLAMGGNGECRVLAERITATLQRHGNFRALADAIELARINSDADGNELTAELIEAAVGEVCPAPERKRND